MKFQKTPPIHNPDAISAGLLGRILQYNLRLEVKLGQKILFAHITRLTSHKTPIKVLLHGLTVF